MSSFYCSAKNYCYQLYDCVTHELVETVVKVRGFQVSGKAAEEINPAVFSKFIQALNEGKVATKDISQFKFRINGKTREVSAEEVKKIYSNAANKKRFHCPKVDESKLWAFGTTKYNL